MKYRPAPEPGEPARAGVLIANLGTPDAPTPKALRRYLRQFLLDPRVIELPRPLWWTILHLAVLPFRPRKSAALYRKVWTPEGSPLLVISRRQQAALAEELARWRWVPELRTVHHYFDRPAYVEALAASVREAWRREPPGERLLFSFHGIPQRYADAGDPYPRHCRETARLAAERLGLPRERWVVSFQSLFGKEEWLRPYTDQTIRQLAAGGVRRLDVVCPGFSADCLETIEEIDEENREVFLGAGGESYRYVPALNDRPDHVRALAELALENLHGWVAPAAAPVPAATPALW